ncbi:MAG: hypothetical protein H7A33_05580 [Deltaproteobacteria bacterium]|nr:hypothetical protein [Deltaproteobacteria bacterium]
MAALKGVGHSAIDSILQARQEGGPYQSFFDFCSRVDLRRVTKKVVEVLIKSGAFDGFGLSRNGMFAVLGTMVDLALKNQKDKELGQNDLFGDVDQQAKTPTGIQIPEEEWSQQEVLSFEKSAFGFYFSGHPLQVYEHSLKRLTSHTINELSTVGKDQNVTLGGTILSKKVIFTKSGKKMAFAELEDLTGKLEIIVFSRTFEKEGDLLQDDEPLLVKGTIDHSDEGDKIIVESLGLLSESLINSTRSIHLDLAYQEFTPQRAEQALNIFREFSGNSQVCIHLKKDNSYEATIDLPGNIRVMACERLQHQLDQVFKRKVVRFQ